MNFGKPPGPTAWWRGWIWLSLVLEPDKWVSPISFYLCRTARQTLCHVKTVTDFATWAGESPETMPADVANAPRVRIDVRAWRRVEVNLHAPDLLAQETLVQASHARTKLTHEDPSAGLRLQGIPEEKRSVGEPPSRKKHQRVLSGPCVCRSSPRRLSSADRIEACLAIDLVVAWRIFHLTKLGWETPEVPCTVLFKDAEWKALAAYVTHDPLPAGSPADLARRHPACWLAWAVSCAARGTVSRARRLSAWDCNGSTVSRLPGNSWRSTSLPISSYRPCPATRISRKCKVFKARHDRFFALMAASSTFP